MNEKYFELTNSMLTHLKSEKEKIEYTLRQVDIQIQSLEDFKIKLKGNDNVSKEEK